MKIVRVASVMGVNLLCPVIRVAEREVYRPELLGWLVAFGITGAARLVRREVGTC
jgi:hypothetical protein